MRQKRTSFNPFNGLHELQHDIDDIRDNHDNNIPSKKPGVPVLHLDIALENDLKWEK